jgi:hypothetical protein
MSNITPFRQSGAKLTTAKSGLKQLSILWWAPTLEDADTCGDREIIGLPLVNRQVDEKAPSGNIGGYDVQLSYEGLNTDEPGAETMEWDGTFREADIEEHPFLMKLLTNFGGSIGEDGRATFPLQAPDTSGNYYKDKYYGPRSPTATTALNRSRASRGGPGFSTGRGRGGFSDGRGKPGLAKSTGTAAAGADGKNPLFGMRTYPQLTAVFRRTYATKRIPSNLIPNVGKILKKLPTGYEELNVDGHDWLMQPPKVRQRGNAFEISEELLMSPYGGWPEAVHGLIQSGFGGR